MASEAVSLPITSSDEFLAMDSFGKQIALLVRASDGTLHLSLHPSWL